MLKKIANLAGMLAIALVLFLLINSAITAFSVFSPKSEESVAVYNLNGAVPFPKNKVKLLCFNTGYAALGQEASLSKEGGSSKRASIDEVLKNARGIAELAALSNADAVLLQSVDVDSHRSRYVDQYSYYLNNGKYSSAFAFDQKSRSTSLLPPNKKVSSGVLTLSKREISLAKRVALPKLYGGLASSKPRRCMLVTEMPIENSDKKLILINFEIDAYLSAEQKEEQTAAVIAYAKEAASNGDYVIAGGSFYQSFDQTLDRYPLSDRLAWQPSQMLSEKLPSELKLVYDAAVPTARILSAPYDAKSESRDVYVADGYILSKNIEINMIVTVDQEFRFSAHNPVLLEVTLK